MVDFGVRQVCVDTEIMGAGPAVDAERSMKLYRVTLPCARLGGAIHTSTPDRADEAS